MDRCGALSGCLLLIGIVLCHLIPASLATEPDRRAGRFDSPSPLRDSSRVGANSRYASSFSCDNGTTFCPSGSTCCNFTQPVQKGCVINGVCCRQGVLRPPSSSLPNCLILGDSVSDGYTPLVQAILNTTCQVQHTPYAYGSGGAGPTTYGLACLDHFLLTGKLQPVNWDVILFNFGLHNLDNSTVAEHTYEEQLTNITTRLMAASKKVLYALTTPYMPDYTQGNHVVEELNGIAAGIMKANDIPLVDLYGEVVSICGPLPYKSCAFCRKDPCSYHYTPQGYEKIAAPVAEAIRQALKA